MYVMSDPAAKSRSANVIPVVDTMPADLLTPLSVYLKLSAGSQNSFLLESVEGGKTLARYSFIGADPDFVLRNAGEISETSTGSGICTESTSFFDYLNRHFDERTAAADPDLPAFIGGAIGYLGFDCCEWFEPKLANGKEQPDAALMFFRSTVAFDHAKQLVKIITLVFSDEDKGGRQAVETAKQKNLAIRKTLESEGTVVPASANSHLSGAPRSNWARTDFESAVGEIKELINAGECYQAVLSQCFTRPTNANPVAIYRALRSLNPSPYMFLLDLGDKQIIGASPEMLVRCEGTNLEYRPIAGTRKRGRDADEDDALAREMAADEKEVAEHRMLVDLGRNDLGRVADFGSVKVDKLMAVEKYSHVQHLVSSLSAELRPEFNRFDALASCFPAGTVSGAPKVRAIEIIRGLEPNPRGIYAGAVGYFDYAGNMDTCIAIRTLVLQDGIAKIQAGGGIVADSVPALEFEESVNKARVLLKAVDIAEGKAV